VKVKPPVSIENLLDKTDGSIYKLVILASKRALELNEGSPRLVESESKKISAVALEEIKEGKICMKAKKK
jgi:DNA-directed RNA polymerase omega subunit